MNEVVRTIVHTLLDRYEQPNRQNTVRVRLSPREHPLYFSAEDSTPRHDANGELLKLAQAGMVRLRWRKWEDGNWLEAVDLLADQAASLYTLLGRNPLSEQEQALRQLLDAEKPRSEWHARFLSWAHTQLDAHRSIAPLDRDDLRLNTDLLRALTALAELRSPILERTLSVRLFGDSKRQEALRGAIIRILRHHDAEAASFGDDEWALLRAHNLDRAPEYLPIAGPLVLQRPVASELRLATTAQPNPGDQQLAVQSGLGQKLLIDLAHFQPSVALSAAMVRDINIVACDASIVVTVENATSFNELLAVRPADILAVYIGGFASPTAIRLLRAIRTTQPDLALLHWGDLDAGGLRILAHLRAHLGYVAPLAMNPAIFEAYRAFAQPLSDADRAALVILRENNALADCAPLIDALLAANQKLEQEAVDVGSIQNQLSLNLKAVLDDLKINEGENL